MAGHGVRRKEVVLHHAPALDDDAPRNPTPIPNSYNNRRISLGGRFVLPGTRSTPERFREGG